MLSKITTLSLTLATCVNAATAQDIIKKNNGETEQVKVKEVGPKTITYKRWGHLNGPDFLIPKTEVKSIEYENGQEDIFNRGRTKTIDASQKAQAINYGKNIVSLAPIWLTNTGPVGLGFSYERFLDKKNIISVILPVAYSFSSDNNNYSGSNNNRYSTMVWAYPGAKFYVGSKSEGKVSYAVGLSAILGSGQVKEDVYIYDPQTQTQRYTTIKDNISLMGAMLHNSVNIQPSKHLYLGIELGLGIPYYIKESIDRNQAHQNGYSIHIPYSGNMPVAMFNFKIGYRF